MTIGQLARRAGVTPDTVRFYERRGVLPPPDRLPSGYRVYGEATVERLELVRGLQAHGFTLDEIVDALQALDRGTTCSSEIWRLEHVLERLDRELEALLALRRTVQQTLASCRRDACDLLGSDEARPPAPSPSAGPRPRPGARRKG